MEQGVAEFRVGELEEGGMETGSACPYPNLEEKFLILKITYNLRIMQLDAVLRIRIKFFQPSLLLLFLDPGRDPGWEKIRIRDKHPGSATLAICHDCIVYNHRRD